jgi:hypothetical protein
MDPVRDESQAQRALSGCLTFILQGLGDGGRGGSKLWGRILKDFKEIRITTQFEF